MWLGPSFWCNVTRRRLIAVCRSIGTAYLSHRQGRFILKMGPTGWPETSMNNYNIWCVTTQKSEGLSYILKYRVIMAIFFRNFKTNFYDISEDIRTSQSVSGCWNMKTGQYYFARWDLQFFFPFKNVNKWRVICGPVNWVLCGIGYNCLHTPSRLRVSAHFVITEFNRHTASCLYNYIRLSIITRRLYYPPFARVFPPATHVGIERI